jgi:hypothetical protein
VLQNQKRMMRIIVCRHCRDLPGKWLNAEIANLDLLSIIFWQVN